MKYGDETEIIFVLIVDCVFFLSVAFAKKGNCWHFMIISLAVVRNPLKIHFYLSAYLLLKLKECMESKRSNNN